MKIDGAHPAPIAVPARSPDQSPGQPFRQSPRWSPSQSFAEVLAAGKSVSEITSQRALGFSETGLFGVSRADETTIRGAANGKAPPPPETFVRNPASEFAKPPSRSPGATAQTESINHLASELGSRARSHQDNARSTGFAPDTNAPKPATHSRRAIVQPPKVAAKAPLLKRQRRKRADPLEIIGADTALTVLIDDAGDEPESASLLLALAQLAGVFGVTIQSVVLDRRRVDFSKLVG